MQIVTKLGIFPIIIKNNREIFRTDSLNLTIEQRMRALTSILTKDYDKGYIRYLIESDIPLFLIKESAIKKDLV